MDDDTPMRPIDQMPPRPLNADTHLASAAWSLRLASGLQGDIAAVAALSAQAQAHASLASALLSRAAQEAPDQAPASDDAELAEALRVLLRAAGYVRFFGDGLALETRAALRPALLDAVRRAFDSVKDVG